MGGNSDFPVRLRRPTKRIYKKPSKSRRWRRNRARERNIAAAARCENCGGVGPHFVPPSLGEGGFWLCDPPYLIAEPPTVQQTESEQ